MLAQKRTRKSLLPRKVYQVIEGTKRTSATDTTQITEEVLWAVRGAAGERVQTVLGALIRHAHDFAREVNLQPQELLAAADFLMRCGQISDQSRHELILLSDVTGMTMVVDTLAAAAPEGALETSVLGPFYRAASPLQPNGTSISRGTDDGEPARIHGRVIDLQRNPIPGAELDVWGTNGKGLYENVDPDQPDYNLRGRFRTETDGSYEIWTAKPVSYPIPTDGPVGELLAVTNRETIRPAHFHVIASAPGFRTVITELYTDDDPYIGSDPVFGVKDSLVVHYRWTDEEQDLKSAGLTEPFWDLRQDFVLIPGQSTAVKFSTDRETTA
jgi:protocatechuate 3,4-dioxygenase beta subunit